MVWALSYRSAMSAIGYLPRGQVPCRMGACELAVLANLVPLLLYKAVAEHVHQGRLRPSSRSWVSRSDNSFTIPG